jgi:iron complex outermembrane receptor protein
MRLIQTKKSIIFAIIVSLFLSCSLASVAGAANTTDSSPATATRNGGSEGRQSGDSRIDSSQSALSGDTSKKDSGEAMDQKSDDVPVTEVEVREEKHDNARVGPLGEQSLQDTPYSLNVTSADSVEDMQAASTSDALKYNPTVQATLGSNLSSDYFMIRGFTCSPYGVTANVTVDGLRSAVLTEPLEDKERIEVLNGASSFLYGFASPGGMINYVLKRPTVEPLAQVKFGNYGGSQAYTHLDFGGPLDADGKFGYRINLVGVNKGEVGIDHETHERYLMSSAFDWHISPNTVWSFDASKYHRKIDYQQAIFLTGSATELPDAPDLSENYGAPYAFTEDTYTRYGTEFQSKLNDTFTLRTALRYTASENLSLNIRNKLIANDGNYTVQMQCKGTNQLLTTSGQLFLDASFDSGSIGNQVTLGIVETYVQVKYAYPNGSATYYFPATDVLNIDDLSYPADPNYELPVGGPLRTTERTRQRSIIVADRMELNPEWVLLVGGNYATIYDDSWNVNSGEFASSYDKSKFTPGVAVLFKPIPAVTTYVSYIESLQQGPTAPDTAANAGEVLDPYVSTQVELGVKTVWGMLNLNAALFRINKANTYDDPFSNIYSLDGREVHTGFEFSVNSKITADLTLGGGFSVLNAEITKADNESLLHKSPRGVPEKLFRLYSEYNVPGYPGLILTGGVSYTGAVWVNTANTLSIPAAVVGDLGLRYLLKVKAHDVAMRLTVNNITNASYWTSKGDDMIYPGKPRTIAYSAELKF